MVDELDGIYVDVPVGFTDSRFPDENYGFLDPLTFDEGRQKMDGTRTLQYVRSRHGNNNQGSDFARAKRQQQVIQAISDEITSVRILTNFKLISRILDAAADNFRTNLQLHEIKRLYDIGREVESRSVSTISIDGESGLVCDEIIEETGAYVLIPCEGLAKYNQIRAHIANQFVVSFVTEESPIIEIQNTTNIDGLSGRTKTFLSLQNAQIEIANYQGEAQFQETVIYDNTRGAKPKTLEYLKKRLGSTVAASAFPFPTNAKLPDFVIVVTNDLEEKL